MSTCYIIYNVIKMKFCLFKYFDTRNVSIIICLRKKVHIRHPKKYENYFVWIKSD